MGVVDVSDRRTTRSMWQSDRRLYLNAEGKVVEADDPSRASLLVGEGGQIPADQARTLGLIDAEGKDVKAEGAAPAENAAPARVETRETAETPVTGERAEARASRK